MSFVSCAHVQSFGLAFGGSTGQRLATLKKKASFEILARSSLYIPFCAAERVEVARSRASVG